MQKSEQPIEIRGAESLSEVDAALRVMESAFADVRGWQANRARHREVYSKEPNLVSVAVAGARVVGAVGCDGIGVVETAAVLEGWRGQGLGRRLLIRTEDLLRGRGAKSAGLGSLDGAVGFYLSCGYRPQLLVQFAPEVEDPEPIIAELLAVPLAGRQVYRRAWRGHPQLWLDDHSLDWDLKRSVEGVAVGVVAQYVMSKQLQSHRRGVPDARHE